MKKFALFIYSLFLTLGISLISFNSYGQNMKVNNDVQLTRKEKKEAKKAELMANFDVLNNLIEHKSFIITAYMLENKYGDRIQVTPVLNFIRVDSTMAVLQTGSNNGFIYNGVGGVTAEGRINGWKVIKNFKNLSYYIHFTVESNIGTYDVSMYVSSDNVVRAEITGTTPGNLVYDGRIEPLNNSTVFKGQTNYY